MSLTKNQINGNKGTVDCPRAQKANDKPNWLQEIRAKRTDEKSRSLSQLINEIAISTRSPGKEGQIYGRRHTKRQKSVSGRGRIIDLIRPASILTSCIHLRDQVDSSPGNAIQQARKRPRERKLARRPSRRFDPTTQCLRSCSRDSNALQVLFARNCNWQVLMLQGPPPPPFPSA